jgi:hypothetical protein
MPKNLPYARRLRHYHSNRPTLRAPPWPCRHALAGPSLTLSVQNSTPT